MSTSILSWIVADKTPWPPFRSVQKQKNVTEDLEILLLLRFCWILFSSLRGEVKNVLASRRQGWQSCFSDRPNNINLLEDVEISGFKWEVENVSANQRQKRPFIHPIGLKNTNLVEDIEILLLVKFRLIPFCRFRGEVWKVSANQRRIRSSCFPDRSKNTLLVEDVEILLPVKSCWIPFSEFRREVENV